MNKYLYVAGLALISNAAFAGFYIEGKIGATDMVIESYQYMYYSPDSPKSTVVDATISDINASYHVGIGYDFMETFRLDFQYGYGKFVMSGDWSLNTKNMVSGDGIVALPPNISYPSTYTLTNRTHLFTLNGYYNVFTFDRRYKNGIYTDINSLRQCCYDALYVVATLGMVHIADDAVVDIDTTLAWGGSPLRQTADNGLDRFVFGAGIGLSFGLSPDVSIDISYKYMQMGDYNQGETQRTYTAHNMLFGIRYEF